MNNNDDATDAYPNEQDDNQYCILDNYTCIYDEHIKTFVVDLDILNHIKILKNFHDVNKEHWMKIYESLKNANRENNLIFPGTMVLCNYENDLYLIDGYHRYFAIKRLWNNNDKQNDLCTFRIDVVTVTSYDEIIDEYKLIHNTQQCNVNNTIKENVKATINFFKEEYNSGNRTSILKNSERPRIPYISIYDLTNAIEQTKFLLTLDIERIKEIIQKINKKYTDDFDPTMYSSTQIDDIYLYDCYLGIDHGMNWVELADNEARKLIF